MNKYPKTVFVPLILLLAILILSFLVPFLRGGIASQYDLHFERALQPPSLAYPFGTDSLGRDLFSITFMAAKSSFMVGFGVVFLAALI